MKTSELIALLQRIQSHTGNPDIELYFYNLEHYGRSRVMGKEFSLKQAGHFINNETNPPKAGIRIETIL